MAPTRGAMCSRQAQLGQSKPKGKQTDSKSNSLQAQSARSHQHKSQRRREQINKAAEQDASRAARQNADRGAAHRARRQNCARQEDNGAPKTLLRALEKTLRGLGFTDTEVTLFRRQVAAKQLPDLTSLSFTELTSLVMDSKIESSSEMLCRALTELQRHLTELSSKITSLRPSETYELFWMIHGVKPFDPTKINADRAIDLIEAGILGQEAPQLQEDLKQVVISAAHSAKQSRPHLSDIFDKIIARYLPPSPTEEELLSQRCMCFVHRLSMELKEAHRAEKLMHQTQNLSQHAVVVTHLQRALVLEQHLQGFGRPSGRLHSWLMRPSKYGDNTPRATMYGVDTAQLEGHMHIEYGQTDDESEGEQGPSEEIHPVANDHGRPSTSATAQQVTQAVSPPAQEPAPSSLGHTTATSLINNGNDSSAVAQGSQGLLVHVTQNTPTSSHLNGNSVVTSADSSSRQDTTSTQQVGPLPAVKYNQNATNLTAVDPPGQATKQASSASAQTLDLSSLSQDIGATIGGVNNSSKNETAGYDGDSESDHVNASDDETDSSDDDDATTAHKVQRSGTHASGSGLLQRATPTSRRPHPHPRRRTNTAGITRAQGQARQQPRAARVAPKQVLTEKQQRMIQIIAEAIEKVVKVSGNELNAYSDAKPLPSGLRLTGDKYTDYDQDDLKMDWATIMGSSCPAPSGANPAGSAASGSSGSVASGSAASGSAPPAPAPPVSTPTVSGSHPPGSTPSGSNPPNTTSLGSATPGSTSSGSNTSNSNSPTSTPPTSDQSGEDDSNDALSDDENASDNESLSDDDDSDDDSDVEFQLSKTPGSAPPTSTQSEDDSDDEDVDMDDDKAKDEAEKKAKKKAKFRRLQVNMGDVFDL